MLMICLAVQRDLYLYADDSAIMVSGNNVHEIDSRLSVELQNVIDWLECNILSLHLGKTEHIVWYKGETRGSKHNEYSVQCK